MEKVDVDGIENELYHFERKSKYTFSNIHGKCNAGVP